MNDIEFIETLKQKRNACDYSQSRLAQELQISRQNLNEIENGKTKASKEMKHILLYEKEKEQKSKGIKTDIKNRFEIRLKSGKAEQTIEQLVFSRNPEQIIANLILTQIDFPVYILWDIFLDNVTTSLPFIMTPVAVNMDKTKRWLERQVMPSLLMIKEIEKQTGANYLEEIDRHTRLTEKQELKIKQMTTDIADMIEKDTAVPQGNDGIF